MKKHDKNSSENNHKTIKKRKYKSLEQKERELILWFRRYLERVRNIGECHTKQAVACVCLFLFLISFSVYADDKKTILQIDGPNATILGPREVNESHGAADVITEQTLDMLNFRFPNGAFSREIYIVKGGKGHSARFSRNPSDSSYGQYITLYLNDFNIGSRWKYWFWDTNYNYFGVEYLGVIWNVNWLGNDEHRGGDEDMTVWRVPNQTVNFITSTFGNSFDSRNNKKYRFSSPVTFSSGIEYFNENDGGAFDKILSSSIDNGFASIQVYPEAYFNDIPNNNEGKQTYKIGWQLKSTQHCHDTTYHNRFYIYLANVEVYKDYTPPVISNIRLYNSNSSNSIPLNLSGNQSRVYYTPYAVNKLVWNTSDNLQSVWGKPRLSTVDISYNSSGSNVTLYTSSYTTYGDVQTGAFTLSSDVLYTAQLYLADGADDIYAAAGQEQSLSTSKSFGLMYISSLPQINVSSAATVLLNDGNRYLRIKLNTSGYQLRREVLMLVIPLDNNQYKRCIVSPPNQTGVSSIKSADTVSASAYTFVDFPSYEPYNATSDVNSWSNYYYSDVYIPVSEIYRVCGSSINTVYVRGMVMDPAWWGSSYDTNIEDAKHLVLSGWVSGFIDYRNPSIKINNVFVSDNGDITINYTVSDDDPNASVYAYVQARYFGTQSFLELKRKEKISTVQSQSYTYNLNTQRWREGEYYITLSAQDNVIGSLEVDTTAWYVLVDTTPPRLNLSVRQKSGANGYLEVTGTAEIGMPIEVYKPQTVSNGQVISWQLVKTFTWDYWNSYTYRLQGTIPENTFVIPLSELGTLNAPYLLFKTNDGVHPVVQQQVNVSLDLQPPTIESISALDITNGRWSIRYRITDNDKIVKWRNRITRYSRGSETQVYVTNLDYNSSVIDSSFDYPPSGTVPDGIYVYYAEFEDYGGNIRSLTKTFTIDSTPPAISSFTITQKGGKNGYYEVKFVSDEYEYERLGKIMLGGVELPVDITSRDLIPLNEEYSKYRVVYTGYVNIQDLKDKGLIPQNVDDVVVSTSCRFRDTAGNESSQTQSLVYDARVPVFSVTVKPPEAVNNLTVQIRGTASDNRELSRITLDVYKVEEGNMKTVDERVVLLNSSTFDYNTSVSFPSEGDYRVQVILEDESGNSNGYYYNVTIDTTPPRIESVVSTQKQGQSGYFVVEFKDIQRKFEGVGKYEVYVNDVLMYTSTNPYASAVDKLNDNENLLSYQAMLSIFDLKQIFGQDLPAVLNGKVKVWDKAGNVSERSFVINYDTQPLQINVVAKPQQVVNSDSVLEVNIPNAVKIVYELLKSTEGGQIQLELLELATTYLKKPLEFSKYGEGTYIIRLQAETLTGNVDNRYYYVTYDITPPTISSMTVVQQQGEFGYFKIKADVLPYKEVYVYANDVFIDTVPYYGRQEIETIVTVDKLKEKFGSVPQVIKFKLVSVDEAGNTHNAEFEKPYNTDLPTIITSAPKQYVNNSSEAAFTFTTSDTVKTIYELYYVKPDVWERVERKELTSGKFDIVPEVGKLGEGNYVVKIMVEDESGNSNLYQYQIVYDTTPPHPAVVKKTDIYAGKVHLQLESEYLSRIRIYDSGQLLTDTTSQGVNFTEYLMKLGQHNLEIVLEDQAGNITTSYHLVEVKQAPPVNSQEPTLYGNEMTVMVTGEPGCELQLVDNFGVVLATASVDYLGRAVFQDVPLPKGENTLKYVSKDLAGNVVEGETFKMTVTQLRPLPPQEVMIEGVNEGNEEPIITKNDFTIKGKTYPNTPVMILLNGELFAVVTSTTDGSFEYTVDKIIENGEYYLQTKVYKDGLESRPTSPIKFVLEVMEPALPQLEVVLWQNKVYEGSTFLVRVFDKTTGKPVDGAKVIVQDEEYVTDEEGYAGKRGSPIVRGIRIKSAYDRAKASSLRKSIGAPSYSEDNVDNDKEVTIYAATYEGVYKKYGVKKVEVVKQDKKNLFVTPNKDGVNDIISILGVHNPVKIYNLQGRLVRTLYENNGEIVWDGLDDNKQPVPGGVYLYVTSDGQRGKIYVAR
jgi:hypothetical protein